MPLRRGIVLKTQSISTVKSNCARSTAGFRFLQRRIPNLKVVESPPGDQERVFFGAWVELERESGERQILRIVGPDEFDQDKRYISMDSPMGKALLGKRLDDDVLVRTPGGEFHVTIDGIFYGTERPDPEN